MEDENDKKILIGKNGTNKCLVVQLDYIVPLSASCVRFFLIYLTYI